MSTSEDKARAQRLARLKTSLSTRLEQPMAVLETLLSELRAGERHPALWEELHGAAARDGKDRELKVAYETITSRRKLQQLDPWAQAEVLVNAANFFQGVLGDAAAAETLLGQVLAAVPDHAEALARLERRLTATREHCRLIDVYAVTAAAAPKLAPQLLARAVSSILLLPATSPLPEPTCSRLMAFAPTHPNVLDVLETHCKTTGRFALACALLERSVADPSCPEARAVGHRRRLIELYLGKAATPAKAMAHVEYLLEGDPSDAGARAAADRLLATREVASRAAALLQKLRRLGQP